MAIIAGQNLELTSSNVLESTYTRINKEGHLLILDYTKGTETGLSFSIEMYIDDSLVKTYRLTETDADGNIVAWSRQLLESMSTIYPFRLPGRCTKFKLTIVFSGSTGSDGTVTIGTIPDTFYHSK